MRTFIKHIIKISFFFILFVSTIPLWAQDTVPGDTVVISTDSSIIIVEAPGLVLPDSIPEVSTSNKIIPDTIKHISFISGIEIGIDYLKFAGLLLKTETKYEGSIGVIFKNKYSLNIEIGEAELTPANAFKNAIFYKSKGRYARIGLNYFLISDDKNFLSAGLRYGMSRFTEDLSYKTENDFGFSYEETLRREDLKANWYEITLSTEGAILKNLYAGAIFRFRILGNIKGDETLEAFNIPGYGRGIDKTIPAFNLYLKYWINF